MSKKREKSPATCEQCGSCIYGWACRARRTLMFEAFATAFFVGVVVGVVVACLAHVAN